MPRSLAFVVALACMLGVVGSAGSAPPATDHYLQTNLASNIPGLANHLDADLVNPWGLCRTATSPWWNSDNGPNKSSLFNASGVPQALVVAVAGAPTGCVAGGIANNFLVAASPTNPALGAASFIFDSEDGAIRAWRGGNTALVTVPAINGSSYKGIAISNAAPGPRLYVANFGAGTVDVFNGAWQPVFDPGQFTDPDLPPKYAPFNVQTIGSRVFVTYGIRGSGGDELDKRAAGIVDVYDLTGVFLHRVATASVLNAPWGLAQAPATGFGDFGGDLLVGNFGDGRIHAYREREDGSWKREGVLSDSAGRPIVIDGLWALQFGNAGNDGTPSTLYFNAGPNDENDGLFGTITHP
jgi:uncharacterized protein (TIGR03118 family)